MYRNTEISRNITTVSSKYAEQEKYWLEHLSGELTRGYFPYDYKPTSLNREVPELHRETAMFPTDLTAHLLKLSNRSDYTMHMIFMAAAVILLAKYSGNHDVIVGMPIYKQDNDVEFVNTVLAIRMQLRPAMTFKELLLEVRQTLIQAEKHQDYPLELLVSQLDIPSSGTEFSLFDVAVLMDNIHDKKYLEHLPLNMIFSFNRTDAGVEAMLSFNPELYQAETARRILRHFLILNGKCLPEIGLKVIDAEILDEEEKKQLLCDFNNTAEDYEKDKTIVQLFEEQARQKPDYVAVLGDMTEPGKEDRGNRGDTLSLTYGRLNERSNRLAGYLRQRGIRHDTLVGIMEERTAEMAVTIMGTLKAGGAYVPIKPYTPKNRLTGILEDTRLPVLITRNRGLEKQIFSAMQGLSTGKLQPEITTPRTPIANLDTLIPDRTLVDYSKYNRYIGHCMAKNAITIQASRGCPYHCAYCHKIWPKKQIFRSPESIFQEVKENYDMGIKKFAFVDDIFNFNVKNSSRFFEMIIDAGLKPQFFFPNGMRGDVMTKDYIDLMVEAGTVSLALALETASPRLQKLLHKNLNLDKFRETCEYFCKKHPQVILELFTMHGFPGESETEALMTLEFLKSLRWVHFPYVNVLKIYPNTDIERIAIQQGISREAILRSEDYAHDVLSDICPFTKKFSYQYRAEWLNEYFLSKERLLHVLPYQLKILSEDELLQKYNTYLPTEQDISSFENLLEHLKISKSELGLDTETIEFVPEESPRVYQANLERLKKERCREPEPGALRVLLLDLSQFFSSEKEFLYDIVGEAPLGIMYVLTYLHQHLGNRVVGKVAKSRVDFDSYRQLRNLLEEFRPDVIGLRALNIFKHFFHKVAALIRQWGFQGPIIAGGPYATTDTTAMLQDREIDLAVLSEGEETFLELIREIMANHGRLPGEEKLKTINGIAFIPGKQEISHQHQFARQIIMLDELDDALERQEEENLEPINHPRDLAYAIFTSGSTGRPKGTLVRHENVNHLVQGLNRRIYRQYPPGTHVAQVAPYIFDASVKQVFGALLQGHTLCIVPEEARADSELLLDYYARNCIEISDGTPAHIKFLLETIKETREKTGKKPVPYVKQFIIGGEALPVKTVAEFLDAWDNNGVPDTPLKVTNIYGLTECTVDSTSYDITGESLSAGSEDDVIPIGMPMMNTRILILNRENRLQPVGVPGELCIGGDGVGRGYLNKPELTGDKYIFLRSYLSYQFYIPHKPHRSETLYKTGDLARWKPDGNIEFLGREDRQVKVRGYRIELEEIERRLLGYQDIKEAIAQVKQDVEGEKYICAYIVLRDPEKSFDISVLREYLTGMLPEYMVPSRFMPLEKVPLTPNGKVDRRALPEPVSGEDGVCYQSPQGPIEEKLVQIWAEILKIPAENIGVKNDFFQLGGHSLRATILIAKIHKALDTRVPLQEIFKNPTISGIATYIKNHRKEEFSGIPLTEEREYYPLSSSQKRVYVVQQMDVTIASYTSIIPVIMEGDLDFERLREAFAGLIRRHESLRTSFHTINGEPVQTISGQELTFDLEDYRMPEEEALSFVRESFVKPFDLGKPPLLRAAVIETGTKRHILAVSLHHIIADGSSMALLMKEFTRLYQGETLTPPRLRYVDYCQWQNTPAQNEAVQKQEKFWLKQFETGVPRLNLPTDFPRPELRSLEGSSAIFRFTPSETREIKQFLAHREVTLYMFLLAAYNVFLFKITGQEDIAVGTPIANRRHADLETLVGMFANILVMRNYPGQNKSFIDFLYEVKKRTVEAFDNQDYKLDDLMDRLMVQKDLSRNSLFDVGFSMQNMEIPSTDLGNLRMTPIEHNLWATRFDMVFVTQEITHENEPRVQVLVEYSKKLFKPETIQLFIENFREVAVAVLENPNIRLADIPIATGKIEYASTDLEQLAQVDLGF